MNTETENDNVNVETLAVAEKTSSIDFKKLDKLKRQKKISSEYLSLQKGEAINLIFIGKSTMINDNNEEINVSTFMDVKGRRLVTGSKLINDVFIEPKLGTLLLPFGTCCEISYIEEKKVTGTNRSYKVYEVYQLGQ